MQVRIEMVNTAQRRPKAAGPFWQPERRESIVEAESIMAAAQQAIDAAEPGWALGFASAA